MSILKSLKKAGTIALASAALSAGAAEQSDQYQMPEEPTPQTLTVTPQVQQDEQKRLTSIIDEHFQEKTADLLAVAQYNNAIKDEDFQTRKDKREGCQDTLNAYKAQAEAIQKYTDKYQELASAAREKGQTQFEFDGRTFDLTKDAAGDFANVFIARDNGDADVTVAGKTYSTQSQLSLDDQQSLYGNINAEVASPQNGQTKILMNAAVKNDVIKKKRLYEIAAHSGYPEIEPAKESSLSEHAAAQYVPPIISLDTVGHIHLTGYNTKDVIDEMAHAFRNKNHLTGEIGAAIADGDLRIASMKDDLKGFYKDKTTYEGDTHEVVELEQRAFVEGYIKTIPELYALIDVERQKNGSHWTYTEEAKQHVEKGYKILKAREKGASEAEIQKILDEKPAHTKINPISKGKLGNRIGGR